MKHVRHIPLVVGLAAVAVALALASAGVAAPQPTRFALAVRDIAFTDFTCGEADPLVCEAGLTGAFQSPLGNGTVTWALAIDFSPGFDSPCNTVDEQGVFTFADGTLTVSAHHCDCAPGIQPGPHVDAPVEITGGTGAWAGASGEGTELVSQAGRTIVYVVTLR
jgi:hypothetical protein